MGWVTLHKLLSCQSKLRTLLHFPGFFSLLLLYYPLFWSRRVRTASRHWLKSPTEYVILQTSEKSITKQKSSQKTLLFHLDLLFHITNISHKLNLLSTINPIWLSNRNMSPKTWWGPLAMTDIQLHNFMLTTYMHRSSVTLAQLD